MTDQSQFRTPQEIEAFIFGRCIPRGDFWEVEKSFEVKVRVIAEAETPEEEPSVSFARSVLDKNLLGDVELPDEINLWLSDYFKRHPEAEVVFDDMCKELVLRAEARLPSTERQEVQIKHLRKTTV